MFPYKQCNKDFLKESAAPTGILGAWIHEDSKCDTPFFLTSVTICLLFTWCFRSTKPQDPVLSILSHFMWQLSLFHIMITTLKFIWHFSSLPASLNSYTNDVNTYRTIANRELISTKCTGACFHRVITKKILMHTLKKCIESPFLMEIREPEFIALFMLKVPGVANHWCRWILQNRKLS